MEHRFDFFITTMPETRSADYHLGCLDGSVFLDFDDDDNDRVRLKRISFDGYGCCELGGEAASMDRADSRIFKGSIVGHIADQSRLTLIIRKTIKDNRNLIWADALREYGFF